MNELIKTTKNEMGEVLVNGRELHEFLEVVTDYKDWFPRMVKYGFIDGNDFSSFLSRSTGGRPKQDHALKIGMAKEVSMIQRTEKGKEARQYFIAMETEYKQQLDTSNLSPELQMFNQMFKSLANQELETKELKLQSERIENKVDGIKDLLSMDTKDWRKEVNSILRKIAMKQGGFEQFSEIGNESYRVLEDKARCNLDIRLENRRKNMIAQGIGKSTVKRLNKLDIISDDHRLKEIYVSVVKNMAIKYDVWEEK